MWKELLNNLVITGVSLLIFIGAYLSNVAFSLWYNLNILKMSFERKKLITSGAKLLSFCAGLVLLCVSITMIPIFAKFVGWAIPEEFSNLFTSLVIIGAILIVACRYLKEAFEKFLSILKYQKK